MGVYALLKSAYTIKNRRGRGHRSVTAQGLWDRAISSAEAGLHSTVRAVEVERLYLSIFMYALPNLVGHSN